MTVYLEVWQNSVGIQVSIGTENDGYRIAGPKFDGTGKCLKKVALGKRDAEEIRRYLRKIKVVAETAES